MKKFLLLAMLSFPAFAADIPEPVTHYMWENVYEVRSGFGGATGFWVGETTFITACHAISVNVHIQEIDEKSGEMVERQEHRIADSVVIQDITGELRHSMLVVSCDQDTDLAILKPNMLSYRHTSNAMLPIFKGWVPQGEEVFSCGYPLNKGFICGVGHWNAILERRRPKMPLSKLR